MNIVHNLTNKKFGRLTALEPIGKNDRRYILWKCKCECGSFVNVISSCLISGNTQSCGCLQKERASIARSKYYAKNKRLLKIWHNMHSRCKNDNASNYKRYGGRGIKVCEEWNCFKTFELWALGNGYSDFLTIDRINNDKNYSPDNCRWATMKEQAQNPCTSKLQEIFQ